MPSAEIITIGTELLLGEIVDTNTRTLARTLRSIGIDLYRTTTIGDNVTRIAQAIREALARADIVITTGGLGPTVDDPTRQAVADAAEIDLEYHPELWEQIVERIAKYGRLPTENQKRQAYVPKGAKIVPNSVGTAPAFIIELDQKAIISLPGVPREMETLLEQAVIPYLQSRYHLKEVILVRILHTAGISEGVIDEKIGDLEKLSNPTVGLAAHSGIVDVRITAKAKSARQAKRQIDHLEAEIRWRLGRAIFGVDDETLEGVILKYLRRRGWKLAVAESGCKGYLTSRLSGTGLASVPVRTFPSLTGDLLPRAVYETREQFQTEAALGIAITDTNSPIQIALCLDTPGGTQSRQLTFGGHPQNAPRWAVNMALDWLRQEIE